MPSLSFGKTYKKQLTCLGLSVAIHLFLFFILVQLRTGLREQVVQALISYEKSLEENISVTNLIAPAKLKASKAAPSELKPFKPVFEQKKLAKLPQQFVPKTKPSEAAKKAPIQEEPKFARVIPPSIETTPAEGPKTKTIPSAPAPSRPGFAHEKQVAYLDKSTSPILRGSDQRINVAPPPIQREIAMPKQIIAAKTTQVTAKTQEIIAAPERLSPQMQEIALEKITPTYINKQTMEPVTRPEAAPIANYQANQAKTITIKPKITAPKMLAKTSTTIAPTELPKEAMLTHKSRSVPSLTRKKAILAPKNIQLKVEKKSITPSDKILEGPQYYSPQLEEIPSGTLITTAFRNEPSVQAIPQKEKPQATTRLDRELKKSSMIEKPIPSPPAQKTHQAFVVPKTIQKEALTPSISAAPPEKHSLIAFAQRKIEAKQIAPTIKRILAQKAFPGKRAWTSYINDILLQQGTVHSIIADKNGEKWFGMDQGLVRYKNGRWKLYTTSEGLAGNKVYSVAIDANGDKWIGTDQGVSRFDGQHWQTFTTEDGLISNHIRAIRPDEQGNLWFATNKGVSKFDGKKWTAYTTKNGLVDNRVNAIAIDSEGKKWFATAKGVSSLDKGRWQSYTTENSGLANNLVYAAAVDGHDVWFGTDNGASRFNGRKWRTFTKKDGLVGNTIYAIQVNKLEEKWFGTDNGISMYNDLIWKNYGTRNGLTSNYVFSIASDNKGSQWFGTDNGVSELAFK